MGPWLLLGWGRLKRAARPAVGQGEEEKATTKKAGDHGGDGGNAGANVRSKSRLFVRCGMENWGAGRL